MQREGFERLTVSQKIRKLASLAREVGRDPSRESVFWEYVSWMDTASHPRLKKAASCIFESREKRSREMWYHLAYDLLALNHETYHEEDFLPAVFDRPSPLRRWPAAAILVDIRSPFNAGSMIRTAEAFGWSEVSLCGITPPISHPRLSKTSMQTHEWMTIRQFATPREAVDFYRGQGYTLVALEVSPEGRSLWEVSVDCPLAVMVGNEEFGIPEEVLPMADMVVTIPLYGRKLSLNVANAFAIVSAVFTHHWGEREMGKTETPASPHPSMKPS